MNEENVNHSVAATTYTPDGNVVQDIAYEYDLVGNILVQHDRTPDCGIIDTLLGTNALDKLFTYDPIYRLCAATGRESNSQPTAIWMDPAPPLGTPNSSNTQAYKQKYCYDALGRMTKWTQLGVNGWTRNFTYSSTAPHNNNQLLLVTDGSTVPNTLSTFGYDYNGNMTTSNTNRGYSYDHADRMRAYFNAPSGSSPTVYSCYYYDAAGQRVKKFIWTPGSGWESVTYIDGIFEYRIKQQFGSTIVQQKNYYRLQGGIEVRYGSYTGEVEPPIIYQVSDHLNSVTVRLDDSGTVIDREEYYPYGETSLRTFSAKRYRYIGKELDSESGLYHMGARYYAPWIASFTSTDPLANVTVAFSPYNYAFCNPIMFSDPDGDKPIHAHGTPREHHGNPFANKHLGKKIAGFFKNIGHKLFHHSEHSQTNTRGNRSEFKCFTDWGFHSNHANLHLDFHIGPHHSEPIPKPTDPQLGPVNAGHLRQKEEIIPVKTIDTKIDTKIDPHPPVEKVEVGNLKTIKNDAPPIKKNPPKFKNTEIHKGQEIDVTENIQFKSNTSEIVSNKENDKILDTLAGLLNQNEDISIDIYGNTAQEKDENGNPVPESLLQVQGEKMEFNGGEKDLPTVMQLRALAVYMALLKRHVKPKQIRKYEPGQNYRSNRGLQTDIHITRH